VIDTSRVMKMSLKYRKHVKRDRTPVPEQTEVTRPQIVAEDKARRPLGAVIIGDTIVFL